MSQNQLIHDELAIKLLIKRIKVIVNNEIMDYSEACLDLAFMLKIKFN